MGAPGPGRPARWRRCCSTCGTSRGRGGPTAYYAAAVQAGTHELEARSSSGASTPRTSSRWTSRPFSLWVDGAVRPGLRAQLVEPPAAAGDRRRAHRARDLPDRAPLVRRDRGARRRRGPGAHPRRRADVPLRQPRRDAHAAAGPGRLRAGAGDRGRAARLAAGRGGADRPRVPDQEPPGLPCAAALRPGVARRRAGSVGRRLWQLAARGGDDARRRRLVGRDRRADARLLAPLHRRRARTTACSG